MSNLQTIYILVSLILAVFGGISTLVVWLHRRMRSVATEVARESGTAQAAVAGRIDAFEGDLKVVAIDVRDIKAELARSNGRLTHVESTVANLPSREDIHNLTIVMTRFEGRMNGVDQRLQGITAFTDRFQDWLLEQGR